MINVEKNKNWNKSFNIINVFTVSFEQIIVSFLEKTFYLFNIYTDPKPLNGNVYSINII